MKPLLLTMQAFGCYGELQQIDFRRLRADSLFLIHGPTGSGKTTILDAVCFALYGRTSGDERSARQMRSQFAAAAAPTSVSFDFSIAGRCYRITRSPKQQVAGKRSRTVKEVEAKVTLWERTGFDDGANEEGRVIAVKSGEADRYIEKLLGLGVDQFRQVIMIPQGQFRRLLTSDVSERKNILAALFGTGYFRRIEDELQSRVRTLADQVRNFQAQLAALCANEGLADAADITGKLAELGEKREEQRALEHAYVAALKEARAAEAAGRELEVSFREFEQASKALQDLQHQQQLYEKDRRALEQAQRALPLREVEAALRRDEQALQNAREELQAHEAALGAAKEQQAAALHRFRQEEEKQAELRGLEAELLRLQQLKPQMESFEQRLGLKEQAREAVEKLASQREALAAEAAAVRAGLESDTLRLSELKAVIAAAGENELLLQGERAVLKKLQALAEVRQTLTETGATLKAAEAEREGLESAVAVKDNELKIQRRHWQRSQVALLAAALEENEPCPVCGSTSHPRPAAGSEEAASPASLEKIEAELEELRQELLLAQRRESAEREKNAAHAATAAALEAGLAERIIDCAQLVEQKVRGLNEKMLHSQQAVAAAAAIEPSLAGRRAVKERVERGLGETEERLSEARLHLKEQESRLEELRRCIPEDLLGHGSFELHYREVCSAAEVRRTAFLEASQDLQRHEKQLQLAVAQREASGRTFHSRERDLETARVAFASRLQGAGFSDEGQFRAAVRGDQELESLAESVAHYEKARAAAQARVMRAREATEGRARPDLSALEELRRSREEEHNKIVRHGGELEAGEKRLRALAAGIRELSANMTAAEAQQRKAGLVAELAAGRNDLRLSFESFVLLALLDDVLVSASERLRQMSRGRYELRRSREIVDRRAQGGLDLEVFDHYTGYARAAATLSGGESFLASLALALGLSDVVQGYSGGVRMETMFIDEGFGTLDGETLDLAFRTLRDLQQGGRLVGIISHVPELKEQIDVRIEVTPGRRGSVARMVLP